MNRMGGWGLRTMLIAAAFATMAGLAAQEKERMVVLPGTIQGVLGGANWDPASAVTRMSKTGPDTWEFAAEFPKGSYEYKVALDGSWAENYGLDGARDGPNIVLNVPTNGTRVRFVFNYGTKLVKDSVSGGIGPWSEPSVIRLIGIPGTEGKMAKGEEGVWSLSLRLPKGSYAWRVRYEDDERLTWGRGGRQGGEALRLDLAKDAEVTFFHRLDGAVSWDSATWVAVPRDKAPAVRIPGLPLLRLTDEDRDNLWTGVAHMPSGKSAYECGLLSGSKTVSSLKLDFNEVAPAYPVEFRWDAASGAFSTDYVASLSGPDGKIVAASLFHDSRDSAYRSPFGALPLGSTVTFTLSAKARDLEKARLIIRKQTIKGAQDSETWSPTGLDADMVKAGLSPDGSRELWTATVKFDTGIAVYGYHFLVSDGAASAVYANNDQVVPVPHTRVVGTGGVGRAWAADDDRMLPYRLTVYDPAFKTPDWARDAVIYYIFPERFRNGNPKNDPVPGKTSGYAHTPVEFHKNWLDPKPWVPGGADGNATDDGNWCNDFYGGDLAGITEKLDYIRDLGVNLIYLNPIFQAPSNHKYDTADYMKVDPGFGTLKDFDTLLAEARKRGIRIILDTSLNHSGSDSVYMDRYGKFPGKKGAFEGEVINKDSPYYSWYRFMPGAKSPDQAYAQWANPTLATLAESDGWKDFAYRDKNSVTKYWLKRGIGGWRMDVTPWKSDDFWRGWRKAVKETNPDALTIAETWFDSSKYFLGDTFDSTMNYIFRQALYDYCSGGSGAAASSALEMMRENYPPQAFGVLMNLLSTHDAARALYQFGYKGEGESAESVALAKKRLLLAVFFQMTYPGAPAIYYGDEVGMTGGEDPFNRGPFPWDDLGGDMDKGLLASFRALTKLRADNPVLRRGSVEVLLADEHRIVMLRKFEGKTALVAVSNAEEPTTVRLDAAGLGIDPTGFADPQGGRAPVMDGGMVAFELPALSGRVFLK